MKVLQARCVSLEEFSLPLALPQYSGLTYLPLAPFESRQRVTWATAGPSRHWSKVLETALCWQPDCFTGCRACALTTASLI